MAANRVETNEVAPNVDWLIDMFLSVQSSLRFKRVVFRRTIVSTSDTSKHPKVTRWDDQNIPIEMILRPSWRTVCSIRCVPVASLQTRTCDSSIRRLKSNLGSPERCYISQACKPNWHQASIIARAKRCSPPYARLEKFERLDRIPSQVVQNNLRGTRKCHSELGCSSEPDWIDLQTFS